jgi:hypothetical protein
MTYANPDLQAILSANLKHFECGSSAIGEDSNTVMRAFEEFLRTKQNAISLWSNPGNKSNVMDLWLKDVYPEKKSIPVFLAPQKDLQRIDDRLSSIESELKKIDTMNKLLLVCLQNRQSQVVHLSLLPNNGMLNPPLDAVVEPDGDSFIARTLDMPLYGVGDDPLDAIEALKAEIENLCDDLMADDSFTSEWLQIKALLSERLARR